MKFLTLALLLLVVSLIHFLEDTMKMIFVLELLIYPVLFAVWKERELKPIPQKGGESR